MAQDYRQQVGQQGFDLGTQMAPLAAPVMAGADAISPIIEYLLHILGGQGKQPAPSTTSQQVGTRSGPGLRGQMMGPQPKDPNTMY